MPRAASKKTTSVKVANKKVTPSKNDPTFQQRLSTFLSSVKPTGANSSKITTPKIQRKYLFPIVGLVVLLALAYLASRFLVIAWVDKKPLTRIDYYNQLDKKYGHDLREQMIVQSLIDSEAQKRNISASDQEISDEIKKIETEQGGPDKLDQVLQMQGISRDELRNLVKLQILRQKMFASSTNVSDAEIASYIDQNKASLPPTDPNDASATANLKDSVKQQLMQQKLNATFSSWLKDNINSDRVIRL